MAGEERERERGRERERMESNPLSSSHTHRFETGYHILRVLMDRKKLFLDWLPVDRLWSLLIAVACQHTGSERLQVITLLMEIVNLLSMEDVKEKWKKKVELSALKPLWQLYTTLVKECGERGRVGREGMEERKEGEGRGGEGEGREETGERMGGGGRRRREERR